MFIFSKIHPLFQPWNFTNLPPSASRDNEMLTKGWAIKNRGKDATTQKRRRKIPGRFIFGVERRQAGALALRKHVTAPAKLAYAENTISAAEIVRKRELTTRQWTSPGEEAISRRGTWSVDEDLDLFSILRSVELEHDGCKTVSNLWIVMIVETCVLSRRWMEFHVGVYGFFGFGSWICSVKKFLVKLIYVLSIKYVTKSSMEFKGVWQIVLDGIYYWKLDY